MTGGRVHAPVLDSLGVYPFVRLAEVRAERRASGKAFYDFSVGEPRERTPSFLREALVAGVPERTSYPPTVGTPALRESIAGWVSRRFGVQLDPEVDVLATSGSKEALYSIHAAILDPKSARRIVWIPELAYPVYEVGARMAGAEVRTLPLDASAGFLPDFSAISPELWEQTALIWLNSPHNPTGATLGRDQLQQIVAKAREEGVWIASDEAYVDLYFADPPPSALEFGLENVVSFHTTSKRSALAGFRSGFIAGDRELLGWLRKLRPSQGVASPLFVQAAATAAWGDDEHAALQRETYAKKRELLRDCLERAGLEIAPSEASLFLFFRTPAEESETEFVERLLAAGIGVVGSETFRPRLSSNERPNARHSGWIRLALVPTLDECEQAVEVLERLL